MDYLHLKWKNWGKQPCPSMRRRFEEDKCPNCGSWNLWNQHIVGFSTDSDVFSMLSSRHNRIGTVVQQCSKCSEFYTSPIDEWRAFLLTARALRQLNADYFKYPEARNALLQMLKEATKNE